MDLQRFNSIQTHNDYHRTFSSTPFEITQSIRWPSKFLDMLLIARLPGTTNLLRHGHMHRRPYDTPWNVRCITHPPHLPNILYPTRDEELSAPSGHIRHERCPNIEILRGCAPARYRGLVITSGAQSTNKGALHLCNEG